MPDVIVIGAGAAGIAAARAVIASGHTVEIIEARDRVGGRCVTGTIAGRPLDLGAHWMHMAEENPLVALADRFGIESVRAPGDYPTYADGQLVKRPPVDWSLLDAEVRRRLRLQSDCSLAECLPGQGEWSDARAFGLGLYSGAPVEEVSARDYNRLGDGGDRFPRGGYGALLAKLAEGVPVRFGRAVTAVRSGGNGVVVVTADGKSLSACAAIVTVPTILLARGAIRFEPELPASVSAALASFRPGAYEHAILRWPESPFAGNGPDRLTFFRSDRIRGGAMLTALEGSDLHYFELGGPHKAFWRDGAETVKRRFVMDFLESQFGAESRRAEILHVTDWWSDPFALGSWSVCPPGASRARNVLRDFGRRTLRFASEATALAQANTVGGAWLEGERAAKRILATLA